MKRKKRSQGTKLTAKQKRFVEEYCTDFCAAAAARRVGYSEHTAGSIGHENLGKPHIAAAIEKRLERLSMTAGEATLRLTQWGRGSLEPFLRLTGNAEGTSRAIVDLGTAEAMANLHLIKKVKQTETILESEKNRKVVSVKTEIELYSALDSVIQILRVHGKIVERHELNLMAFLKGLSPNEAEQLAQLSDADLAKLLPPGVLIASAR